MSILVFSFVLHTIPSFARISIKTLVAPPPDDGDDDDDDGDVASDGDGDIGGLLVQAPTRSSKGGMLSPD